MKQRYPHFLPLFLITLLLLSGCNSFLDSQSNRDPIDWQDSEIIVPADEDALSDSLQTILRTGAEKQAIRYIEAEDSSSTELPDMLIDLLYNGLAHIATSDLAKAEEVLHDYEIRVRKPVSSRQIHVYVDSSATWLDAWKNGSVETGHEQVDSLTATFDMTLLQFTDTERPGDQAVLEAGQPVNVFAVGRAFEEIEEINSAGPDGVTDGNEISFMLFADHVRYVFEYGYGDCPAGCIYRHRWHFNVYKDGAIDFVGEDGDPLPE